MIVLCSTLSALRFATLLTGQAGVSSLGIVEDFTMYKDFTEKRPRPSYDTKHYTFSGASSSSPALWRATVVSWAHGTRTSTSHGSLEARSA